MFLYISGMKYKKHGLYTYTVVQFSDFWLLSKVHIMWYNLYQSRLKDGYFGDGVHHCSDVNECVFNIHDCSDRAKCTNLKGNFTCECLEGYEGDGKECLSPAQVYYLENFFENILL